MNPSTPQQPAFFSGIAAMQAIGGQQPIEATGTGDVFNSGFQAKHELVYGGKGTAIGKCWRIRIISFLNEPFCFRRTIETRKISVLSKDRTKVSEWDFNMPALGTAEYQEAMQLSDHNDVPFSQRPAKKVDRLLVWVYEEGMKQPNGYVQVIQPINAFKWIEFKPSLAIALKDAALKVPNNAFRDEVFAMPDGSVMQWLGVAPMVDSIPMYDCLLQVVPSDSPKIPYTYSLDPIVTPIVPQANGQPWPREATHENLDQWVSVLAQTGVINLGSLFDLSQAARPPVLTKSGEEILKEMETHDLGLDGIRRRLGYKDGQFNKSQGLHYGQGEETVVQPQYAQTAPQMYAQPQVMGGQPVYAPPAQPVYAQPQQAIPGQPVYAQPVQAAPAQPVYAQPQMAPQPVYAQPVQAAPQPVYAPPAAPQFVAPQVQPQAEPASRLAVPQGAPVPTVESAEQYENMPVEQQAVTAVPRFGANPQG